MKNLTSAIFLTIIMLLGGMGTSSALPRCPDQRHPTTSPWLNCFGTNTYANGDKYVGEHREGKRHGQGTYTFGPSSQWRGDKYVGEFRDNESHGQGTYTFANGRIKEGIWKDNVFQYAQKVTPPVVARKPLTSADLCIKAINVNTGDWDPRKQWKPYADEAKRRGLSCEDRIANIKGRLEAQKGTPPVVAQKPPSPTQRNKDRDSLVSAASGSGFAVSVDGYVVTNYHVVEGCQTVKVHYKGEAIPATVVSFDPINDLALLKGNFRPKTVLALNTRKPELLQDIYVAGYPFGTKVSSGIKVTRGIISSLSGIGNNFTNIQIDAAIQPGNSGGPILDDKGNVVGVAVSRLDKFKALKSFGSLPENTNFGIKASLVRSILEGNDVSFPDPNSSSISKTELGNIVSGGTYYLSCWMTTAQIEQMRSKKVLFQNLD